ncbi:MAG TPA: glycosyltransferase family 4 protein [Rhodanobacteraceae bacterium]|jgi:glycosyltransferase involved in cell wall biosynthesis|nr:glycosyltransferase family 4 protein [Rhodanobacteraceae bacterium]
MTEPVFFTIVSRNYLAYALTLMQSLAQPYPDAPRYLCLADSRSDDPALNTELFETVTIDQLPLPHFNAFVFRYDIMELNTAVKPYMFAWLRERHPGAGIVYLDPDILVLRRLEKIEQAFARGALAVLTPHLNAPIEDDRFPDELSIMRSGVYNCGFAAINGAHSKSDALMEWWADKLEYGCFVDLEGGLFTDQKWMDLVPGMFPDVTILRDDGYNVAYWNLAQRPVRQLPDGSFTAGGVPLVFAHFSGVVLADPKRFSKHQNRFDADSIGGLRPLYDRYLELLRINGHREHARKAYAYGTFADGEKIAPVLRRVYRRLFDVRSAHPVLDPQKMDRSLFNQPCDELPLDHALPVSRVMYETWCMRTDLQDAFNLHARDGRDGFVRWFLAAANAEMGIPDRYVTPIRQTFMGTSCASDAAAAQPQVRQAGEESAAAPTPAPAEPVRPPPALATGLRYRLGQAGLRLLNWGKRHAQLQRWYSRLPFGLRMALRRRAYAYSGVPLPPTLPVHAPSVRRERSRRTVDSSSGVNLVGYARGEFGIAENVRSYARALDQARYPFVIRNFDVGVASRQGDLSMERHFSDELRYATNVFFINADQMHLARDSLGSHAFAARRNIGFWVWELEKFPDAWRDAFKLVDEVWAPTEYVRTAIAACTGKPVLRMPKAIEFETPVGMDRAYFGLDATAFTYLYSYDFNSFASRKNPEAAIAAFRQAFADGKQDVRLLVKSINGTRFPDRMRALAASVADDPRIEVRDGFLSRDEMFGLQNAVDCYISPHRAEGFGLGMAESMYLGKPVVATGYSGNLDFMDRDNSLLIDYRMVALRDGEYPFWQGQQWADPDVGHAAKLMRLLYDDRELARRIGGNAARSIRRSNSRAVCAAAVTTRLATPREGAPVAALQRQGG